MYVFRVFQSKAQESGKFLIRDVRDVKLAACIESVELMA
jgi:hypothetical protein